MPLKEPEKLYYSIGEVSRMTELPASVLRFWETEFEYLRPPKNRAGKRVYRKSDVGRILRIRKLLYEDGFTIAGARKMLKAERGTGGQPAEEQSPKAHGDKLPAAEIRRELKEILRLLSS